MTWGFYLIVFWFVFLWTSPNFGAAWEGTSASGRTATRGSVARSVTKVNGYNALAAIPQPRGQACSKRHGSLEMPALRAEGEIRDERFWPEGGENQEIGTPRRRFMPGGGLEFEKLSRWKGGGGGSR